jgi:DNA-binding MarR family transcriptional regulator
MTDALTIRKAVNDYIQNNPQSTYASVVESVADELSVVQNRVRDELDRMEKNGFIYCVDSDDGTVVKVP